MDLIGVSAKLPIAPAIAVKLWRGGCWARGKHRAIRHRENSSVTDRGLPVGVPDTWTRDGLNPKRSEPLSGRHQNLAGDSSAMSDYELAVERAMGLADFERSQHSPGHSEFHLERMRLLAEKLGDIHKGVPTVHVAGTKGKGSTAAMISAALSAEGHRVGLFTSPHLHSILERVRLNLEPIRKETFSTLVEQVWPAVQWVGSEGGYGGVTFFELMTALAFHHFKQVRADFQVIEVGLGGRLDSTNVVVPALSVLTSISLDHVATLGDTIEKIAREKAGIIKAGVPVVLAPQAEPDATRVFREVADDRSAPLFEVQDRLRWTKRDSNTSGQAFTLSGMDGSHELWTPLIGDHQLENAATAVMALETLNDSGYRVSRKSIAAGLRDVRWPGRLEVLQHRGRTVVVDGAHNAYSVKRLVQAVREYFSFDGVVLVFAALSGHSARGMLSELKTLAPRVVIVRSRHPRSGPTGPAARVVSELGLDAPLQSDTVSGGFGRAMEIAGSRDLVLCTGSLSVAAEVIEELRGIQPELYPTLQRPPDTSAIGVS